MKLTDKQKRFCDEYLIDLNATQAAIRAGYSDKAARQVSSRLLTNANIQQYLSEKKKKTADKLDISRERVLLEYARLAFFDIRKIYEESGDLKPITELSADEAAAIGGVKRSITTFGEGDHGGEKVAVEVKIWNKNTALDSIARMQGYNAPDKVDHTTLGESLNDTGIDNLSPEDKLAFIRLRQKMRGAS